MIVHCTKNPSWCFIPSSLTLGWLLMRWQGSIPKISWWWMIWIIYLSYLLFQTFIYSSSNWWFYYLVLAFKSFSIFLTSQVKLRFWFSSSSDVIPTYYWNIDSNWYCNYSNWLRSIFYSSVVEDPRFSGLRSFTVFTFFLYFQLFSPN